MSIYHVFQITTVQGPLLNTEAHFKTKWTIILQLLLCVPKVHFSRVFILFLLIFLGSFLSREVYDLPPFDRALYKLLLRVRRYHRKE
jgi:hypothetical protein